MIYLTTGANGAGKTLLTLKDVRAQQLRENRPVYYHGFEAGEVITQQFGWKPFDPRKWQDLPDGSICIFDECQNEFGSDLGTKDLPDYVKAIAQFRRKRGFDFWMVTPNPMMLHAFVRRCVENPSWHRHLKRAFGADMVSVGKFNYVNTECEKPGSFDKGEVSMVAYPKEVYAWYKSASLHTAKKAIPRAVWFFVAAAVLVPVAGYLAFKNVLGKPDEFRQISKAKGAKDPAQPGPGPRGGPGPAAARSLGPLTAVEYFDVRRPRVEAFPHTAPIYDGITSPKDAPYPAACVIGKLPAYAQGEDCRCWTQQATQLQVPVEICRQIATKGFFMDWAQPRAPVQAHQVSQGIQPRQESSPAGAIILPSSGTVHGITGELQSAPVSVLTPDPGPPPAPRANRAPRPS